MERRARTALHLPFSKVLQRRAWHSGHVPHTGVSCLSCANLPAASTTSYSHFCSLVKQNAGTALLAQSLFPQLKGRSPAPPAQTFLSNDAPRGHPLESVRVLIWIVIALQCGVLYKLQVKFACSCLVARTIWLRGAMSAFLDCVNHLERLHVQ